MVKRLRVMVVMGGMSEEREVSLATGRQVMEYLNKEKHEAVAVVIDKNGGGWEKLKKNSTDVVFIALHGRYGEDGKLQGLLDWLGIKYTGSGVLASSIGMDKLIFRQLMVVNGVPMAKIVNRAPCVVKPVDGGSSVGVSIVTENLELEKAVDMARKYGGRVLVEEYIKGIEVSCGILGGRALPVIEIVPKNNFFDYEAKYTDGMSREICPARISKELTKRVQELAIKVFKVVGCRGYARVDMIIRDKEIFVLEINTLPGLTANSLLPKEAREMGIGYQELLDEIIRLAI